MNGGMNYDLMNNDIRRKANMSEPMVIQQKSENKMDAKW